MKKLLCITVIAIICITSCTKNNPNPDNNNSGNTGNNNNGGGNNSSGTNGLMITSISPANPHINDTITITGTGFNPDKTKDTVLFGDVSTGKEIGVFLDEHDPEHERKSRATILQASSTKLVVLANNPLNLDMKAFPQLGPNKKSVAGIQVRTGGKKVQTSVIPFKRAMMILDIYDGDHHGGPGRAGDSLEIRGCGFDTTGATFSIGGVTVVPRIFHDGSNLTLYIAGLRLSNNFFGYENDETKSEIRTVVVRNKDGKQDQKDCKFFISPIMNPITVSCRQKSYKYSEKGMVILDAKSNCLKSDIKVYVDCNANGTHFEFSLGASHFQTSISANIGQVGLGLMEPGIYSVFLKRNGQVCGACSFQITND